MTKDGKGTVDDCRDYLRYLARISLPNDPHLARLAREGVAALDAIKEEFGDP